MERQTWLYDLSEELEYSVKGEFEKTCQLEFKAPCYETLSASSALGKYLMKAIMDSAKNAKQGVKEETSEASIDSDAVQMIILSSDVDWDDLFSAFKRLAFESCTLDGEGKVKLKEAHFQNVKPDDIYGMCFGYIANFIVPSVMPAEGKK